MKIFKLWYDQALVASFWAFVISIVIARTYLPLPEALITTKTVLGETLPLILLVSIPVAVLRVLNRKRKSIALIARKDNGPTCHKCGKLVETGDVLCSEHEQEVLKAVIANRTLK